MVRPERFELPTFCLASVRVRHGESGCAGKAAYGVQAGGLRHALAETKVAAGSGGISQAGNQHRIAGSDRGRHERYRVCEEDGGGQGEGAAGLHDRIALCAAHAAVRGTETTERRGNGPPRRLLLPSTDQKTKTRKGRRPWRGLRIRIVFRITLYWKRFPFQDHPTIGKCSRSQATPQTASSRFTARCGDVHNGSWRH
jgi:hypothetical protein